jgi:hypothetical protein
LKVKLLLLKFFGFEVDDGKISQAAVVAGNNRLNVFGLWGVLISVRTQDIKLQKYVCVSAEKVSAANNRIYKILFFLRVFLLIDVIGS